MLFIDQTEIFIRSGKGGRGMVSFRAGKHQPKAGADGGDGGFGGDVYLVGERGLNTLSNLRHRQRYNAEDGEKGGSNDCTGRSGDDLDVRVPLGTVLYKDSEETVLAEVLKHGDRVLVAKGGKRGIGNARFLSSTHQAPEEYTTGDPGEEFLLRLELKLLADVGFAGYPNAGKSTLLSVISAAKPKIANYPFTTLTPQLGVVDVDRDIVDPKSFVAADIPGLIEGASEGKGLGLEFLRHLERTKIVAFIVDPFTQEGMDAVYQYQSLKRELQNFNPELAAKPAMIVVSKMDLADEDFDKAELAALFGDDHISVCFISSATGEGINEFKRTAFDLIRAFTETTAEATDVELGGPAHLPKLADFRLVKARPQSVESFHP